jgi:hypothetical protein
MCQGSRLLFQLAGLYWGDGNINSSVIALNNTDRYNSANCINSTNNDCIDSANNQAHQLYYSWGSDGSLFHNFPWAWGWCLWGSTAVSCSLRPHIDEYIKPPAHDVWSNHASEVHGIYPTDVRITSVMGIMNVWKQFVVLFIFKAILIMVQKRNHCYLVGWSILWLWVVVSNHQRYPSRHTVCLVVTRWDAIWPPIWHLIWHQSTLFVCSKLQ